MLKFAMLSPNSVLKLNEDVLLRFEANISNGVLFLFDIKTEEFWTGNFASFVILNCLMAKKNVQQIYEHAKILFEKQDFNDIKKSIEVLFLDLLKKKFFNDR